MLDKPSLGLYSVLTLIQLTKETEMKKMTSTEAKEIFNAALANETDADRIAKVELLREYFTNTSFRAAMADEVARING